VVCALVQSLATGNPIYPIFDLRNIKQDCPGWLDCKETDTLLDTMMNEDTMKLNFFKASLPKI